jgi:thiol-disulfide isomerase/thioredoxin
MTTNVRHHPNPAHRPRTGVAVFALAMLLLTSCGGGAPTENDGGPVQGAGGITRLAPKDRGELVEIAGTDLDGNPLSASQWRGKVVVVNVWGSWCPPCRVEQPILSRLAAELKPLGVEFLGIAIRESPATSKAFTTAKGVPYPSIGDGDATILAFVDSLPAVAVPTTYVIDRQGRVATRLLDRATYSTLKSLIDEVAQEPADG